MNAQATDRPILATSNGFELRRAQPGSDFLMISYKGDYDLTQAGYDEGFKLAELYEMSPRGSC
jgi:hypothetical protein